MAHTLTKTKYPLSARLQTQLDRVYVRPHMPTTQSVPWRAYLAEMFANQQVADTAAIVAEAIVTAFLEHSPFVFNETDERTPLAYKRVFEVAAAMAASAMITGYSIVRPARDIDTPPELDFRNERQKQLDEVFPEYRDCIEPYSPILSTNDTLDVPELSNLYGDVLAGSEEHIVHNRTPTIHFFRLWHHPLPPLAGAYYISSAVTAIFESGVRILAATPYSHIFVTPNSNDVVAKGLSTNADTLADTIAGLPTLMDARHQLHSAGREEALRKTELDREQGILTRPYFVTQLNPGDHTILGTPFQMQQMGPAMAELAQKQMGHLLHTTFSAGNSRYRDPTEVLKQNAKPLTIFAKHLVISVLEALCILYDVPFSPPMVSDAISYTEIQITMDPTEANAAIRQLIATRKIDSIIGDGEMSDDQKVNEVFEIGRYINSL